MARGFGPCSSPAVIFDTSQWWMRPTPVLTVDGMSWRRRCLGLHWDAALTLGQFLLDVLYTVLLLGLAILKLAPLTLGGHGTVLCTA